MKNFNEFRFEGLNHRECSNKYLTMNRTNADDTKIIVKVADSHILKTRYGYALILDWNHVVFLKDWQVDINYFGNEVLLTKEYWNVKEWGDFSDEFDEEPANLDWATWVEIAKAQDALVNNDGEKLNRVKWMRSEDN